MLDTIVADIRAASEHVPFGNSAFQTSFFTGGTEGGTECPERRIRSLLLNMDTKLQALDEAKFKRAELEIDLEEAQVRLSALTPETDPHGFERRRVELSIQKKTSGIAREDKLIRDALIELEVMYQEFKSLPQITSREQFEQGEERYWIRRLASDANREAIALGAPSPGTLASLNAMGVIAQRNPDGQWIVQGSPTRLLEKSNG